MDTEIFCLCDGAYNYNGRLTIVGTYDQLILQTVPQNARISIAVKLNIPRDRINNGSRVVLSFKDPNGNAVAGDIVNEVSNIPQNADMIHLAMAANIDLNVADVGVYKVELSINNELLKTKMFPIVRN